MKMTPLRPCLKLCTFDVTNTLLKFKMTVGEQYAKVGRIYGVDRDPAQITAAFQQHWKVMNTDYPNFGCSVGLTSQDWWRRIIHKTFSVDDGRLTSKQLDCITSHLYDIYKNNVCWELVPGALPLLQHLKKKNVSMGVISNFDERLESVLSAYDINSYFNFVIASYVVRVAKPDKKIFDLALTYSPGIMTSNALHIGDDIKLDYEAAKNAGWNALLICDKNKKMNLPQDIDLSEVVEDITQIESHIVYET